MIGQTLSHYKVTAKLGVGGMGEVYRATDTKLGREVAIKVLPEEFTQDPERLARFEREAKVLASVNDPHIAAIYGIEQSDDANYLVLELVEGEDLAERQKRGPIPLDEALDLARQMAVGMEAAHECGIVHRDFKPANVMVTPQGTVKILDFGLAKEWEPAGSSPHLSQSPTLTAQMTEAGMILGTAAYMSPEQARGQQTDKRTDIWAFGVVLWELLTGEQIFAGPTVTDVLAAVLKTDLDWKLVPDSVPSGIRNLLRRCLERDQQLRLRDIGEARIILDRGAVNDPKSVAEDQLAEIPRWRRVLPWAVSLAALILAAGLRLELKNSVSIAPDSATTFTVLAPEAHLLVNDTAPILDISADGKTLVFIAEGEAGRQIFRRSLDSLEVTSIDGTEGAQHPLISPDGLWLAFFANGSLQQVPIEGGAAKTLGKASNNRGAAWSPRGSIVLTPTFDSGLVEVPASGGEPRVLTTVDAEAQERTHRWPQVLPDGNSVLFTVGDLGSPGDYDGARIDVLRIDSGERKTVLKGARMARYVEPGYLLFQRDSTLLAQAFDLDRLETRSGPFSIQERVGGEKGSGAGFFAAVGGTLVFVPEEAIPNQSYLTIVDRNGEETRVGIPPDRFGQPRFSPDGNRIAFIVGSGAGSDDDIWIYDLQAERLDRLTFGQGNAAPIWSPDGKRIVFVRGGSDDLGLYSKPSDGSGAMQKLWNPPNSGVLIPNSWIPGTRRLAFTAATGSIDVKLIALDDAWQATGEPTPLLAEPWLEWGAEFSPNGRYVAYSSVETGINEVFVQSYPSGGRWQVSTGWGRAPVWSQDGKRLYFIQGTSMMEADVDTTGVFRAGSPRSLFKAPYDTGAPIREFDVHADGRFILVRRALDETVPLGLTVIQNWAASIPEEFRAR